MIEPESFEFISQGKRLTGHFYQAIGASQPVTLLAVAGTFHGPEYFLRLGRYLPQQGINLVEFNARGRQDSEGEYTYLGELEDIKALLDWLDRPEMHKRFKVDMSTLALGGFRDGASLAMAFAARDPSIRRLVLCSIEDFGELIRHIRSHQGIYKYIRSVSTQPHHRFDLDNSLKELDRQPKVFDLKANVARLADRQVIMFWGARVVPGYSKQNNSIERNHNTIYRLLESSGAPNLTFVTYNASPGFRDIIQRLAEDMASWLLKGKVSHAPGADILTPE